MLAVKLLFWIERIKTTFTPKSSKSIFRKENPQNCIESLNFTTLGQFSEVSRKKNCFYFEMAIAFSLVISQSIKPNYHVTWTGYCGVQFGFFQNLICRNIIDQCFAFKQCSVGKCLKSNCSKPHCLLCFCRKN